MLFIDDDIMWVWVGGNEWLFLLLFEGLVVWYVGCW